MGTGEDYINYLIYKDKVISLDEGINKYDDFMSLIKAQHACENPDKFKNGDMSVGEVFRKYKVPEELQMI